MSYTMAKWLRRRIENRIHAREPRPIFDAAEFPWAQELESRHPYIRKEAELIMEEWERITNYNSILPTQRSLYQDEHWKAFFLVIGGKKVPHHKMLCPETSAALKHIPGLVNAFFSIFRPGTVIPAHRGPYAGILRYHLGVVIPEGDLGIRVDGKEHRWQEGKSFLFDDSFTHEAWNKSDKTRVVLFADFVRPLPHPLRFWNKLILSALRNSRSARHAVRHVHANQLKNVPVNR